jgi:hypothetical protein
MNQNNITQAEDLNKIASKTGDYVLTGIVQIVALGIGSLIGASPTQSTRIGKFIYRNLGLLISLILSPFLIAALFLMSSQNTERSKINLGSTEATSLEGIQAKVLNVPYFNQWLEPDGSKAPLFPKRANGWDLGNVICGAASSTMVAGYFGKLPYNTADEHDLKRFAYTDQGMNLPSKCDSQEIGGAFGVTAYDSSCNMNGLSGIEEYFDLLGLKTRKLGSISFEKVKSAIDQRKPLIVSMVAPFGHIAVIKGYTLDGRLVMNDPFRNVQDGGTSYSYNGKNALYEVNRGWTVNYIIEISS